MSWIQYLNKYSGFIIFLISILSIVYFSKEKKISEKEKLTNGNFSIGTFKKATWSFGRAGGLSLAYYYYDEEGKYRDSRNANKFPDKEQRKNIFEGDKFFVVYNNDGSLIFYDKPIKDSTDFQRYVKEFEDMRKKQNK
jgi:hypothetical protein